MDSTIKERLHISIEDGDFFTIVDLKEEPTRNIWEFIVVRNAEVLAIMSGKRMFQPIGDIITAGVLSIDHSNISDLELEHEGWLFKGKIQPSMRKMGLSRSFCDI